MTLIRLAYASRANFKSSPDNKGVEPHVARILMSSRRNNPKQGVVGGLYFGDGFFFQCLEGESEAVHDLFNQLRDDERHRDVTLLLEEPIHHRSFTDWSMKYVPIESDVNALLKDAGMERFNPFVFDGALTQSMIDCLRRGREGFDGTGMRRRQEGFEKTALIVAGAIVIIGLATVGAILF
ncbi:blue light sensor protein [Marinobacter halodurans]|uniref:Blue light sensor protein n=1 Tax=Marinobacter halodurans TaxID=2528979 RepID=A0ABY1ZLZ5_9GAMM|nr:BLUF domain-containing protein [Marinobacter halodurans]TBW56901.1 blue light sensor protein [Marinobacter halodurans]